MAKFIAQEIENLRDLSEKYGNLGKVTTDINQLLSLFDSKFSGEERDIKSLFKLNPSLKKDYGELIKLSEKYFNLLNNINNEAKDLATKHGLDNQEEVIEVVELYKKYKDNLSSIPEIYDKLTDGQKHFYNEIKNDNSIISNINNLLKDEKDLNDTVVDARSRVNKSYRETQPLLEQNKKTLADILAISKVVWQEIKDGGNKWIEIDDKISKVGRSIGLSTNQIRGLQENVLGNYGKIASNLGISFEELFKFQENLSKSTGRAISLANNEVESLGAMSKLVGDVATNDMVKNMDDFGASTQTATSYLALNMARARSQGLDAQKASETFAKNVKLASKYTFSEGVNGISKMTLLSQKLKFNMDSIANAAEKFETVEGAIGTAANIQMLGGSYAAQFGNPLEAMNMAMLDMEGFTQKIVDTFSGKAIFNRETGQVEMSAIDKRLMKEAAKQLGISYEEAWNMASQKAKIGDIERQIGLNSNRFSDNEKDFITSKAQYDAETKQHYVTVYQDGEAKRVDVKDLTTDQLEIMRDQKDVEHAMYADVHGLHEKLSTYIVSQASNNKSLQEAIKGNRERWQIAKADGLDYPMSLGKEWLSSSVGWILQTVTSIGTAVGGILLADKFRDLRSSAESSSTISTISRWLYGNKKNKTSASPASGSAPGHTSGGGSGSSSSPASGGGSGSSSSPASGSGSGSAPGPASGSGSGSSSSPASGGGSGSKPKPKKKPSKSKKKSSKPKKKTPKPKSRGRKGGSLGISVNPFGNGAKPNFGKSRIGGLMNLGMSLLTLTNVASGFFNDGEEENISSGDSTLVNENNLLNVNNTEEIAELQKQTALLEVIANNYGVKKNDLNVESEEYQSLSNEIVNGETNSNAIVDNVLFGASMVSKLNPYAQIAMGAYDLYNAHSAYSDQIKAIDSSNLSEDEKNKLRRTASDKRNERYGEGIGGAVGSAIGGALGTMIPIPVVGTAIGAAVGNWVGSTVGGFIGKNVNAASDLLFGKDNMTEADKMQQSYEETKMGIVDIRDPQLEQKAQLAICQIHDIVVSMWHHMNGKQSNGLKEDKGLLGGLGSSINTVNNTIGGALVSTITSPFKVVGGLISSIFNGGAKSSVVSNDSYRVSNINDLSSVDKQYINKASKSLGISEEEFYNQYSYSVNKNGYVDSNTTISGNPIRVVNNNEYDLRDQQQRRDYLIDNIDRNRGRVSYYNKLNSINATYKQLYGLEPKPYNTNDYNSNVNYDNNRISSFNSVNGYSDLSYINHNSNLVDNISVKEVKYNNNGLMSKPTVGEPTFIKNTNDFINQSYNNSIGGNNKIDLNVTGSIKLTSDRGNNVDVDMSKLLNDAAFVRKLTEIITDSLNKNSNGGRRENNSVGSLTYGSSLGTRNQSNSLYR